jgi:tRNA modification GTPase
MMEMGETIVAQATAPGVSSRCVIRLSGEFSRGVLEQIGIEVPRQRGARCVRVRWNEGRELPGLLLWMPGPGSYTGEDCAELQLPGSRVVVRHVMERMLGADGVRLAEPGEFSARAFFHDRLTIEQAEGIAWLIAARNDAELAAARDVLGGQTGEDVRAQCETIAECLALVEAGIDFSEHEDVAAIAPGDLLERVTRVGAALEERLSGTRTQRSAGHEPGVVLVGAPSAGKSTLFNALLGRPRSVVDAQPGTTRDVLREVLRLNGMLPGWSVVLQDLPGLDATAEDDVGGAAQRAARAAIDAADVLVWCDPSGRFEEGALPTTEARVVRVRTKADLLGEGSGDDSCEVCALDGWGLEPVRRAISDAAWACTHTRAGETMLLLPRHEQAMREALVAVDRAAELVEPFAAERSLPDSELVASSLREALDALGQIAGAIDPDDIIGRVFASFCVGK